MTTTGQRGIARVLDGISPTSTIHTDLSIASDVELLITETATIATLTG